MLWILFFLCVCLRVEYLSQIRKARPLLLKGAQWICFKHLFVSIRFVFVFILPSQKLHFQLDKTMNVRLNGIFRSEKGLFATANSTRRDNAKWKEESAWVAAYRCMKKERKHQAIHFSWTQVRSRIANISFVVYTKISRIIFAWRKFKYGNSIMLKSIFQWGKVHAPNIVSLGMMCSYEFHLHTVRARIEEQKNDALIRDLFDSSL